MLAGLLAGRSNSSQIERKKAAFTQMRAASGKERRRSDTGDGATRMRATAEGGCLCIYLLTQGLGFYTGKEIREPFSLVGTVFRVAHQTEKNITSLW